MLTLIEWMGCIMGLVGAALLAINARYSGYGFVCYLISNVLWISFGILTDEWAIVTMQMGFMLTSFVGIYHWFPAMKLWILSKNIYVIK